MDAQGTDLRTRVAQGIVLACVPLAPWAYGCAADAARYALSALLLLAGALWWSGPAARDRAACMLWAAAAALPAAGVLQIALRTTSSPISTLEAVLQIAACLCALCVLADLARARRPALLLAATVLAAAGAQAAFGAVQSSLAPKTIYGVAPAIAQMPFGSYVNHNHFAGLLAMAVPLALGWSLGWLRLLHGPTPASVTLGGLGLGLATVALASRSRGGLLALAAGVSALGLLWWLRHRHPRQGGRAQLLIAGAACVVVLGFAWLAIPRDVRQHLTTAARGSAEASGSYRLDTAAATLRLFASRPLLGAGLGTYADAVTAFKRAHGDVRTTHAESDVLQLGAEAGLLGVLACGALLLVLGRRALALWGEHGDPVRRGVAFGALAGTVGLAVHSFVDFNLHVPANALVFMALLALAAPLGARGPAGEGRASRAAAAACVVILASGCVAGLWRSWGAWSLDRARRAAAPYERLARLGEVVRSHPYLADARFEKARTNMVLAASGSLTPQRLVRADQELRDALRLRPLWGEASANLAWVLALEGDPASAREALAHAQALDPTHSGIRWLGSHFDEHIRSAAGHLK